MFPKKFGPIVRIANSIKITRLVCTRLENAAPWQRVNVLTPGKKEDTVARNILYSMSSRRQLRSRL
jgi:hypothetical protein